ncbi:von Willebrand factor type A domain-containing protein [Mycena filopes]|nr:von Willebrand factor type A domain-containing protein [Mycena filopes]
MSRHIALYGLIYYYEQRYISLPLLGVRAEASIKELAAQVKLTQIFGNDAAFPIEAKYSFPIPARGCVCSFVMIKQDGTRVEGVVQGKQAARETYNTAVAQGQQASLAEQQTADVFEVSVGNIPPNEEVQIELVYATELAEDEENDSIRFHLPVHIGSRYGQAPQSAPTTFRRTAWISSSSPPPFLDVSISVEVVAPISKIGSPSHTVSTELGPDPKLPNFKELPFSNYARVSLSSDSALDKDFVLTVKSAGLDAPRCVAELHPTNDTVAMGLTLVPRFKLPEVARQEFVFMVDRSGSMGGNRIEAAKKALVVMLRALPHQDSLFQIVSFGTRIASLWPNGSKPYNQDTLEEATRHVDSMRADFGGTEIRAALQHCFKARKLDRPMSLLVLTDGDAWDLDGVFAEVKSAVADAPQKAYLRVSVLGIGNSASTAMCEGMARLGNGTCMMVGEEETSFTGKIARMLKAAKAPPISNISIDWGRPVVAEAAGEKAASDEDDFELVEELGEKKKKTLNIFDETMEDPIADSTPAPPAPAVVLPPPAAVQQAPFKIHNLFPNIRLNIYVILQGKTIPETVTIRGSTADGAEIALPVPVVLSRLQTASGAPSAMHTLAARKLIQDLEDGQHALGKTLANPDDTDLLARTVKASIVRLGTTYSLASAHTSFVAVDRSTPGVLPTPPLYLVHYNVSPGYAQPRYRTASARYASYAAAPAPSPAHVGPRGSSSVMDGSMRTKSKRGETRLMSASSSSSVGGAAPGAPSASFGFALPATRAQNTNAPPPPAMAPRPAALAMAAPQAEQSASRSVAQERRKAGPAPPMTRPSPMTRSVSSASKPKAASLAPQAMATPSDVLEALARLQSFDGCFSLEILAIIKLKTNIQDVRDAFPAGATDGVVASVLAMAYLSTRLGVGVERDAWYEKAQQYVEMALQDGGSTEAVGALEAKIAALLA